VLAASDPVEGVRAGARDCVFDFGTTHSLNEAGYNDFELTYYDGSSCEGNAWVFNHSTQAWDRFASLFLPPGAECRPSWTKRTRLLSSRGLSAWDYLDESGRMRIRPGVPDAGCSTRSLKTAGDYLVVPLLYDESVTCRAIAYANGSLWAASEAFHDLCEISLSGELMKRVETFSYNRGLAFDGENLWYADLHGHVSKMTQEGEHLCEFCVPRTYPGGMAWVGGRLWYAEPATSNVSLLFEIDVDASCASGSAVVTDTVQVPIGNCRGLAWDGGHLLVAGKRLYKVTLSGNVVGSHPFPVRNVMDIAWDGEALWVLNDGPNGAGGNRDRIAARFRLR
jgi:hypothetical protein